MRQEVPARVLAIIDTQLRDKGKQNIYDVLERLGVRDVKAKIFDYAWEVPTGAPIFTIWAEEVGVHPASGYMFAVEDLSPRTALRGGAAMDAGQLQRANDRRRLMGKVRDGQPFIAVLQTNERSNQELMSNVIAKPDDRIKDSPWRVARWDTERQRAILVRGENNWSPTDSEIDQFLRDGCIGSPSGTHSPDGPGDAESEVAPQLAFPDQAHRDLVEARAMEKMRAVFTELKLNPKDVSTKNLGYDLDVQDASGVSVYHVEVKGTAASAPGFFLTRNEMKKSETDPLWELAIVTDALIAPQVDRYTAKEMQRFFRLEPLVWRGELKPR